MRSHYVTRKRDAVAYICSSYVADMYCATSLRDIGISQRASPVQNGSTCIVAGDAASLRDIEISQRANPVQNGSTCIVAGDEAGRACRRVAKHKSLHKRGAAERACRSVSQHKSLHKYGVQKSS